VTVSGFGCPAIPRNRVCARHYSAPPKRSTCGGCPIRSNCHDGNSDRMAHNAAMDDAAIAWERGYVAR
jgi:hypothetical protein